MGPMGPGPNEWAQMGPAGAQKNGPNGPAQMNPLEWVQMGPGPGQNEWAQWARAQGPNE